MGQQAGNAVQNGRAPDDVEYLRDGLADWFEGDGAHPRQNVAAFRTSDQLQHSN